MPVVERRKSTATMSFSFGQSTASTICGIGQRRSGFTPDVTSTRGGRSGAGRTGKRPRSSDSRKYSRAGRGSVGSRASSS